MKSFKENIGIVLIELCTRKRDFDSILRRDGYAFGLLVWASLRTKRLTLFTLNARKES